MNKIVKNTINIGLEKPLKILHITDSHLSFCGENDGEGMKKHSKNRDAETSKAMLEAELAYGRENCDIIVHTGDLIDFISKPCVEYAREFLKDDKILFIAGNHEFWRCDGAREDMVHRFTSLRQIGGGLGVDMYFTSRIVGGVNFVGIDDSFHQVETSQLIRLKMEVQKGYPVILFMHAPLYEEKLFRQSDELWNGELYLTGTDMTLHPEFINDMAAPYTSTKEFYDYVISEPMIKAVLAGHLHFGFESSLPNGTMQYVTDRGDRGHAREITII